MKSSFKRNQVNDNFAVLVSRFSEEAIKSFQGESELLIIQGKGWENYVSKFERELKASIKEVTDDAREVEIKKLLKLTIEASKNTLEELINTPVHNLNKNFWKEINDPIKNELSLVLENCR